MSTLSLDYVVNLESATLDVAVLINNKIVAHTSPTSPDLLKLSSIPALLAITSLDSFVSIFEGWPPVYVYWTPDSRVLITHKSLSSQSLALGQLLNEGSSEKELSIELDHLSLVAAVKELYEILALAFSQGITLACGSPQLGAEPSDYHESARNYMVNPKPLENMVLVEEVLPMPQLDPSIGSMDSIPVTSRHSSRQTAYCINHPGGPTVSVADFDENTQEGYWHTYPVRTVRVLPRTREGIFRERAIYIPTQPWRTSDFVQWGESGLVLSSKGSYRTAFFEAFIEGSSAEGFYRGEGTSIALAEENAFKAYLKALNCPGHSYERRGYSNGGGFCTNCGKFSSKAFKPSKPE